ncbi:hypothetical protein K523DRAFT_358668 [Schizophyllum commune Tattone D]|nr:hypothetical protein K523DRAFT_358668 [Schizophyllum commune Tattone D]
MVSNQPSTSEAQGLQVAFPPLDANDQVIRYRIPNTQSDIGADCQRICVAGHCLRTQLYDQTRRGQLRWCTGCHTLLHQWALRLIPALSSVTWGNDTGTDADVNDVANHFPWPQTTCAELACVPLWRWTMPTQVPQSMETITQEAIQRTRAGMGADAGPRRFLCMKCHCQII